MLPMFCSVKPSIVTEKLTFGRLCFQTKVKADWLNCPQTSV